MTDAQIINSQKTNANQMQMYVVYTDSQKASALQEFLKKSDIQSFELQKEGMTNASSTSMSTPSKYDKNLLTFLRGSDISDEVMKVIQTISMGDVNKKVKTTPTAGSFKWKAQKYPGDIDMLEFYEVDANSQSEALQKVINVLVRIAKDIDKNPNMLLADFKCGYDIRFKPLLSAMGTLKHDYTNPDMIEYFEQGIPNYDQEKCKTELNSLHIDGAISTENYQQLLSILPTNNVMTGLAYKDMYKIIRKSYLLRWSIADIVSGRMLIEPKNKTGQTYYAKLDFALTHETVLKLDVWANIGGRWTEVTNIYVVSFGSGNNNKTPLGFYFKESVDTATAIDIDYYSSAEHEKPYKLAKRIWNRAINKMAQNMDVDGNLDLAKADPTQLHIVKTIAPLFSADINLLGQLAADVEILIEGLKKYEPLNLTYDQFFKSIFESIEAIPLKIFRVLKISTNTENAIKLKINEILKYIQSTVGVEDYKYIHNDQWKQILTHDVANKLVKLSEELMEIMQKEQHKYALEFLNKTKLHPKLANSIVQIEYSFNYLNLPPITMNDTQNETMNQVGGVMKKYMQRNMAEYYKYKYLKYKGKYLRH